MNASSTTRATNAVSKRVKIPSALTVAQRMRSAEESAIVIPRMDNAREMLAVKYLPNRNHGSFYRTFQMSQRVATSRSGKTSMGPGNASTTGSAKETALAQVTALSTKAAKVIPAAQARFWSSAPLATTMRPRTHGVLIAAPRMPSARVRAHAPSGPGARANPDATLQTPATTMRPRIHWDLIAAP